MAVVNLKWGAGNKREHREKRELGSMEFPRSAGGGETQKKNPIQNGQHELKKRQSPRKIGGRP